MIESVDSCISLLIRLNPLIRQMSAKVCYRTLILLNALAESRMLQYVSRIQNSARDVAAAAPGRSGKTKDTFTIIMYTPETVAIH